MTTRLALTLASLVDSGHLMAKLADADADAHPRMPAATMRAIAVLAAEGPMSITRLARRCHLAQPTMSMFVQQAEREGWLRRTGSGRSTRVEPTAEGVAGRTRQRERTGHALEPRFAHLGPRDRAALERAAMIVASSLERDRHTDSGPSRGQRDDPPASASPAALADRDDDRTAGTSPAAD